MYELNNKEDFDKILKECSVKEKILVEGLYVLGSNVYEINMSLNKIKEKELCVKIGDNILVDFSKGDLTSESIVNIVNEICKLQKKTIKEGMGKSTNIGRSKLTIDDLPSIFLENYSLYKCGILNKVEFAKKCKCSRPTLDRWIKCIKESKASI